MDRDLHTHKAFGDYIKTEIVDREDNRTVQRRVFPGDITVYSLCDGKEIRKNPENGETEFVYSLYRFNRHTLGKVRAGLTTAQPPEEETGGPGRDGSRLIQRFKIRFINGITGQKSAEFMKWRDSTKTGMYLEIPGEKGTVKTYDLSEKALKMLKEKAGIRSVRSRTCIQDMALAERLLAMDSERPSGGEETALQDRFNARGLTLAIVLECKEKGYFDGTVTSVHSGDYRGSGQGGIRDLYEHIQGKGDTFLPGLLCTRYVLSEESLVIGFEYGEPFHYINAGRDYVLTSEVVITDSFSGMSAFSVHGDIRDRETGDRLVVVERKRKHSGNMDLLGLGEKWLPEIASEMEEFVSRIRTMITGKEIRVENFAGKAVTGELLQCVGRKRVAAVLGNGNGKTENDVPEMIHRLIHMRSNIEKNGCMKDIGPSREIRLQKALPRAILSATG